MLSTFIAQTFICYTRKSYCLISQKPIALILLSKLIIVWWSYLIKYKRNKLRCKLFVTMIVLILAIAYDLKIVIAKESFLTIFLAIYLHNVYFYNMYNNTSI